MATITEYRGRWRVQLRRKGTPYFSLNFSTQEEAEKWADENETRFLLNPVAFLDEYANPKRRRKRLRLGKDTIMTPTEIGEIFGSFQEIAKKYFSSDAPSEEDMEKAKQEFTLVAQKAAEFGKEKKDESAE